MKKVCVLLLVALFVQLPLPTASASPAIPALANKHPLTERQVGELLIGELRCLACHTRNDAPPALLERSAPDLTDVGSRVSPDFLRKFIASPSTSHIGTTMPDLLAAEVVEKRETIAEALTDFLISRSSQKFRREGPTDAEIAAGKDLFHSVGCVACHSPRDADGKVLARESDIDLEHVPSKFSPASLSDFLHQPARVRPSGRMPDMKLTPVEAKAIAGYLIGRNGAVSKAVEPDDRRVALGRKWFQELNCAACHKVGDATAAPPVGDLQRADATRGCLSETPGKAPRFSPSVEQVKAIRAALAAKPQALTDGAAMDTTLVAFNCVACHTRGDYGGVTEDRNPHFQTSEKGLGDEARVPPPLTLVGAKLLPVALKKMLFDGDSVRPYMSVRMPQFGEPNLRHLPALFSRLDTLKPVVFSLPNPETDRPKERDREREMRAAGREMLGDKALSCVVCHTFNGKSAGQKGIDLMASTQRLQPAWFYRYLIDPNSFRPRTVMPTAWPNGRAALKTVLGGDTDRQIEAIWYYLTLGTSAADPSGVLRVESTLIVDRETRTYRGRSTVAGFRGIAVGFPEKLNYAFNAETGTLSAIWRGGFVRVDRSGQGSGGFNPVAAHVGLAQDVSFFALPDPTTPWPLRPVMTKEAPTNPDPLYPKNRGYQFRGYQLDNASIPTFQYRSGDVEIEDRSAPVAAGEKFRLVRVLSFDAPEARTIWFRALTGRVERDSDSRFKTPELGLSIPEVKTQLRRASTEKEGSELLLRFDIPAGKSTRTLKYELLK